MAKHDNTKQSPEATPDYSNNPIAISVKHLHKSFKLPTERAWGLKQAIFNRLKGVKGYRELKVLNGITFDIHQNEFVGIVGRNGSGKSTLLKTLAKIYFPESGSIEINGQLVPFIELGVGFNFELTGRENVYLNGALLGFSNKEMDTMYDEIVDFAELRDFMDQKLKNYSSGMQVRLAFSIAIRAKGDILLLDEVLAVGDAAFQQKCIDRMKDIAASGRTILFVSHSMANVRAICSRCLLFEQGRLAMDGPAAEVTEAYEGVDRPPPPSAAKPGPSAAVPSAPPEPESLRSGSGAVCTKDVSFLFDDERGGWNALVDYETADGSDWTKCRIALAIRPKGLSGRPLAVFDSAMTGGVYGDQPPRGRIVLELPASLRFPPADYSIDVRLWSGTDVADDFPDGFGFSPPEENATPGWLSDSFRRGLVNLAHSWRPARRPSLPDGPAPLARGGTGDVRVKGVSMAFDADRDGWNAFIDYETADGSPWTHCRAALIVRSKANPEKPLCVFDSATTKGLFTDKPPRGRIVLEMPPDVRFPESDYRIDVRLWVSSSVADDLPAAAEFSPSVSLSSPGWRSPPCLRGRFNLRHAWRVEVDGKPYRDPQIKYNPATKNKGETIRESQQRQQGRLHSLFRL